VELCSGIAHVASLKIPLSPTLVDGEHEEVHLSYIELDRASPGHRRLARIGKI